MVNFGEKLKRLRIENNLTQKQLAERIGLATSAISSYESGNRYPTYDVMAKFARIFHVSTDYLIGVEDSRKLELTGLSEDSIELVAKLVEKLRETDRK